MKRHQATIIGLKKGKDGKKDTVYFTYTRDYTEGLACGVTYEAGAADKYQLGDTIDVIESNFRYMILN